MAEQDLYRVLGVERGASTDQIRKAYRKLARRYHPDVNPGNKEAEERFKEISAAHDVLTDPDKRKVYDEFGMAGLQAGFDAQRARAEGEWAERRAGRAAGPFADGGFGRFRTFEDIFGDVPGGAARSGPQPGADTEASLEIGFMDAIRGTSTEFSIERREACATCAGSGRDPNSTTACPECGGDGRVRLSRGPLAFERTCPRCHGGGRVALRDCTPCHGRGHTVRQERLRVQIPAGVDGGSRIRVAGKGAAGVAGGPAGDLYIVLRVRPHPLLERRGNDLSLDVPVTVGEAVRGATITVPTPSGQVRVRVPPGSQSGRLLRIRGHGVPALKGGGSGDLYVRLMVHVPVGSGEELRDAARAIDAAYATDLREGLRL